MLRGRRIVLAVTGGVAAYKSAYLVRLLGEAGAEVKVILTDSARHFVGPQTFAALTGSQPLAELFGDDSVSPHTELARWADLIVVAPATAATIGRIANGISVDLVSATLLATQKPVVIAPAMHTEMWEHPATQANVSKLREFGYRLVGPESGHLAGGDEGMGRVAEPESILAKIESTLGGGALGKSMLITAGGTREPVDPVRYLGNRSSGKMGHAIAESAVRHGFDVTLVTTSSIDVPPAVKVINVETAEEMLSAVQGVEPDVAVMAAAVADFRPANPSPDKLARTDGLETIGLEPNPDILASVAKRAPAPFLVGFAAETGDVARAVTKAREKNVDLLVYNNVSESGSGFGTSTNRVTVIRRDGSTDEWPLMAKAEVADRLVQLIADAVAVAG